MIEVLPNLFVGDETDCAPFPEDWFVVHACKEPCHRAALGYSSRAAPKDDPEYLAAIRGNNLVLNLIDADDAKYIPADMVRLAVSQIVSSYLAGKKILVHCNQGRSRAPTILLLAIRKLVPMLPVIESLAQFRELYPAFNPAPGMYSFILQEW